MPPVQPRIFRLERLDAPVQIALLGGPEVDFNAILNCFNPQGSPFYRQVSRTVNGQSTKAIACAFSHENPPPPFNPTINVVMIFFDLTSQSSFQQTERSIQYTHDCISKGADWLDIDSDGRKLKEYKIILVGTTADDTGLRSVTDQQINDLKAKHNISEYIPINTSTGNNINRLLNTAMTYGLDIYNRRGERLKEQATLYMKSLALLHKLHNNTAANFTAGILLALGVIGIAVGLADVIGLGLTLTSVALTAIGTGFFATKNSVSNHLENFSQNWSITHT